jgi:hypothetical protein
MKPNAALSVLTLISAILFPWPLTAFLAVASSYCEPLVPLAAGLFFDALYYAPHEGSFPVFTIYGLLVSLAAVFVRNQLRTSIIN